ncbi:MAG TPA: putative phage tail assembly chaperone [bacterium]
MAKAEARKVVITAGKYGDFTFHVSLENYSKLMGEIARNAHMACNNVLLHTIDDADEQRWLAAVSENWGLAIEVGTKVVEQVAPEVGVTVKKSNPSQTS